MPGPYAQALLNIKDAGRFPIDFITLMLHYNTMHGNYQGQLHEINYQMITDNNALASCHPNAIMFMNIVSNANYVNDMQPAVMVSGNAAANYIQTAQAAVMLNNKAIWVKYGSHEGHSHSVVLLTGTDNVIESLEGWAGAEGYFFHESVLEADWLGFPRVHGRPTRAQASAALGLLISNRAGQTNDNPPKAFCETDREAGWNRLSRSGGAYAPRYNETPHICVQVADMVPVHDFRQEVYRRMLGVGRYKARSVEEFRKVFACCHCQTTTWTRVQARMWRWKECTACHRQYCQNCSKLLWTTGDRCECGQRDATGM